MTITNYVQEYTYNNSRHTESHVTIECMAGPLLIMIYRCNTVGAKV